MVGSDVCAFHIVRSLLMSNNSKSFASLSAVEHILSEHIFRRIVKSKNYLSKKTTTYNLERREYA
jgi:hypothetical protein